MQYTIKLILFDNGLIGPKYFDVHYNVLFDKVPVVNVLSRD